MMHQKPHDKAAVYKSVTGWRLACLLCCSVASVGSRYRHQPPVQLLWRVIMSAAVVTCTTAALQHTL